MEKSKEQRKAERERKIAEKRKQRAFGGRKGSPKHLRQVEEEYKKLEEKRK